MNSKKSGTIFIVLIIALIAYGSGSVANAFDLGGNSMVNLIPSEITSFNQQQITQMNDPSFQPVYLIQQEIMIIILNIKTIRIKIISKQSQIQSII
jgi:hypothetical protein